MSPNVTDLFACVLRVTTCGWWDTTADFHLAASGRHYCRFCLALIHSEEERKKERREGGRGVWVEMTCTCTLLPPVEQQLCMLCLHQDWVDWCGFVWILWGFNATTDSMSPLNRSLMTQRRHKGCLLPQFWSKHITDAKQAIWLYVDVIFSVGK